MEKFYDDIEDLQDDLDEDELNEYFDDDDAVIAVVFPSSRKKYYYFTRDLTLKKGQKVLVWANNRETIVTVAGYCLDENGNASRTIRILDNNKKPTKKRGTKTMGKSSKATNSVKEIITETKDVAIKLQYGGTIISGIKSALMESDTIPENVKTLLEVEGYSDFIIGNSLKLASDTFLDSENIKKAADAASFAASVKIASKLDFIQNLVEAVIVKSMKGVKTGLSKDALAKEEVVKEAKEEKTKPKK